MYMAARGERNYVNRLRGTCYYYYYCCYHIIILIIIIPNILISVGMRCPSAEERECEEKKTAVDWWKHDWIIEETKRCQRRGEVLEKLSISLMTDIKMPCQRVWTYFEINALNAALKKRFNSQKQFRCFHLKWSVSYLKGTRVQRRCTRHSQDLERF